MLIKASSVIGMPVLSVRAGGIVTRIIELIVDPDKLKVIGFRVGGGVIGRQEPNILSVQSVREFSMIGIVIDDLEELVSEGEVVRIDEVLELNFELNGLRVETRKKRNLGKISDYTLTMDDFVVQQIIVQRPALKALLDPELTIHRKEIVEVTDYKVVVKNEEETLKKKAEKEEFVPNFVNPFRNQGAGLSRASGDGGSDSAKVSED